MEPTLILCPACHKKISASVEACPQCGHPITDHDREVGKSKLQTKRIIFFIGIVVASFLTIGGIVAGMENKETKQPSAPTAEENQAAVNSSPAFPYTAEDIVTVFNSVAHDLNYQNRAVIEETKTGNVATAINVSVGKYVNLIIAVPLGREKASGVMLIGSGDGTLKSSADIVVGMIILIATMSPELEASDRGGVLRELGLLNSKELPTGKTSAVRGHVRYSYRYVEGKGTFLAADAI